SISGLHLPVHQNPPPGSRGDGPGALLQGLPARDSRNDQDAGTQRPHRKNPWAGPIHPPPGTAGAPAAIGVVRTMKPAARPEPVSLKSLTYQSLTALSIACHTA